MHSTKVLRDDYELDNAVSWWVERGVAVVAAMDAVMQNDTRSKRLRGDGMRRTKIGRLADANKNTFSKNEEKRHLARHTRVLTSEQ